ncbi:Alpha/beta hydrolase family protein [Anatilimnocola aggregata]|uniref:Alpha/beta hydrolase family protein n=1 Tax=Anatilimnocola aggregata TaxID=2528021 RepID=A0A517Y4E5_9BACT|nr:alpha/beta hydrolase [Anatilimnocola aggregata]QDU25123.1 Alpha/beta hydrolase family protein [Anatilimnocola aggregata]
MAENVRLKSTFSSPLKWKLVILPAVHPAQTHIMLLAPLANLLILRPSRHVIPTPDKERRLIPFRGGHLEIFVTRTGDPDVDPQYFTLAFPGTEGRAEKYPTDPLDQWSDIPGEIWTVNPPGYGKSTGWAKLSKLAKAADTVYRAFEREASGRPMLLSAFSMGTLSALHLAANQSVNGLILRNALPLKSVIMEHHGWKGLWLGTYFLTWEVPRALDALRNARRCNVPAVFLVSGKDEVVYPHLQQRVIDRYSGPKQVLQLPRAGHNTGLTKRERETYGQLLQWLRMRVLPPYACALNDRSAYVPQAIPQDCENGVWVA